MSSGKLVLTGTIELISPTSIGSGDGDHSDTDVLRDSDGMPFIPATSFMGVLRHSMKLKENGHDKNLEKFWGYSKGSNGRQSAVNCSDLTLCNDDKAEVVIRDGVKICNKTGIAVDGSKYDYEVIEPGAKFKLYLEIDIQESKKRESDETFLAFAKSMLKTICQRLENEDVYIGAKTNSGLGRIKLTDDKIYEFNFKNNKKDVMWWLKRGDRDFSSKPPAPLDSNDIGTFDLTGTRFCINATFNLKDSLIIRTYPAGTGDQPDAVHIKSAKGPVIPGTSLKGAIRSRAERILNTLGKPCTILTELFGDVCEKSKTSSKGRIRIDEVVLPRFVAETQARIKIDRFTGGTIGGALFDTMPLFNPDFKGSGNMGEKVEFVTITIRDYKPHEAGLMLLVLKDLWTGDLVVGGEKAIGRGVFEGESATISFDGEKIELQKGVAPLTGADNEKKKLQGCVDALVAYKKGNVQNEG